MLLWIDLILIHSLRLGYERRSIKVLGDIWEENDNFLSEPKRLLSLDISQGTTYYVACYMFVTSGQMILSYVLLGSFSKLLRQKSCYNNIYIELIVFI